MKTDFTPDDIKWIKNVTSPDSDSAYLSRIHADNFVLHFPKKHKKGNVRSSSVGEIIILYQKIRKRNVFTHLVTPVDDDLIVDNKRPRYPYGRRVKILAMTGIENAISLADTSWHHLDFRGPSQGNACKIANIHNIHNIDAHLLELWQLFQPYFLKQHSETAVLVQHAISQALLDDREVKEGTLKLIAHFIRERKSSRLVRQKKEQAKAQGKYYCGVCDFSFLNKYDIDYMECHHIYPISQIPQGKTVKTKLVDLELVCANCHKMLHKKVNDRFLSIEELKKRLRKRDS